MFDFEAALLADVKPDLGEASAFYLQLVKVGAATDPPDATGMLEGQFSVPVVNVIQLLSELVRNEFETIYAYTVYAETLRDFAHDAIAEHFQEHAEEELEHATFLLKRMAVLGGSVNVPDISAPHASTDAVDIIKTMCRMEQEGIEGWRKLLAIVGENPMRIKAEEYMVAEQQHLDELCQLLPREAVGPVKVASKEEHERGQASARTGLARKFEVERHTKGERGGDLVGRIAGAVLGGAAHTLHHNPLASVGAAYIGQHIGGKVGKEVGRRSDGRHFEKKGFVFGVGDAPSGDAADSFIQHLIGEGQYDRTDRVPEAKTAWESQGTETLQKKMASALKLAFGEMAGGNISAAMAGSSGAGSSAAASGPAGEETGGVEQPGIAAPAMRAGAGASVSSTALASFLGADRAGQMAELQQQAEYYKQLSSQAQQSAESTGQQLQQVQQQAAELQQQVQMSQQQIEQSVQQSQQIQAQAMAAATAAQQSAAQSAQGHLQAMQESQLHKQLSENMRAGIIQMKSNIQSALAQDPTAGMEMQLGDAGQQPGMQGPTVGGEVAPGGPAGAAPDQELAPGQAPPGGEAAATAPVDGESGNPAQQGAEPTSAIKTSGAKMDLIRSELRKRAPYAAVGGSLGAGAAYFGRPHSKKTHQNVVEAERKGGGPVRDLNTAKHKIRHAMAEYVDRHPVAGSALLGAAAANAAASAGPAIRTIVKGYIDKRKGGR